MKIDDRAKQESCYRELHSTEDRLDFLIGYARGTRHAWKGLPCEPDRTPATAMTQEAYRIGWKKFWESLNQRDLHIPRISVY